MHGTNIKIKKSVNDFVSENSDIKENFNVYRSVHRNNILVYNSNKMHNSQRLFYLTTALHIRASLSPIFRSTKQL